MVSEELGPLLSLNIRTDKREFIYRQIYNQLKREILLHHFLPNEQLPSKRELSETLNVSVNSVNSAYQQLLAEGYIYSKERSGFFVEKLDTISPSFGTTHTLSPELIEPAESGGHLISFSHMSADRSAFPFDNWLNCERKVLKLKNSDLSDDPTRFPQGIYSVRRTIARFLSLTRGVNSFPEQIVLGSGTQVLVQMLIQLLPVSSTYAMEDPGYRRVYQLLKNQKADIKEIKLDKKGISVNEIKRINPNIVYVTPSHQFPTGIVMPISRRIQLLNWASEAENRYIIEDDYDSEFKYGFDTIPSLQGLDSFERVIYIGTFSKSILPGLRISYMVLPQHLVKKFRERFGFFMQTCNGLAQLTLQNFIDSGEYQKHIKHMRQIYSERRMLLIEELEKRFAGSITIYGAKAGLHFMATFETKRSAEEIIIRAKKDKLELYSLNRCYLSQDNLFNKPAFILGFANLPVEKIGEAVDRLYRAVFQ
ncbi:PLP-dependent aminotransferase family protein [Sporolactobacillus sp. THM7-4]|nr:PLP-dependent aminotransferase family protein [Sporolactobacillus sp. THM7-4]